MKLGFFTMPIHPLGRDWRETLREDQEAFLLADELGFCEAYVGEHVTDLAENITSCIVFLASLARRIKTMRLGTGTVNLPNSHPANVAAQIAMLDHMLDGRFNFGISPGGLLSDAEIFGNLDADRNAMFVEGIDTVLKLWADEPPYDIDGKYWKLTTANDLVAEIGQGIIAKPLQNAASADRRDRGGAVFQRRDRRGRARLGSDLRQFPDAEMGRHPQEELRGRLRRRQAARSTSANWRVAKSVFVAEDETAAHALCARAEEPVRPLLQFAVHQAGEERAVQSVQGGSGHAGRRSDARLCARSVVICGTPVEVAEQLLAFREEVGPFGTLLYAGHDWADPGLAKARCG